jgi:hypothetical protein
VRVWWYVVGREINCVIIDEFRLGSGAVRVVD